LAGRLGKTTQCPEMITRLKKLGGIGRLEDSLFAGAKKGGGIARTGGYQM